MTEPNYQKPPLREEIEAFFKQLKGVWGLGSLEREAQETYSVTPELINKWICQPHGYRNVKFELNQKEYDETYLPYLQKYFKIDELPWPTKIIYELRKRK